MLAACASGQFAAGAQERRPTPQQQPQARTASASGGSPSATAPRAAQKSAASGARATAARPEPRVIAVVHKLRGWKLRALVTPPDAPFAAAFDDTFVRMSVVAGYVMADGRSVVARLPRAEAEMLNLSTLFPDYHESPTRPGDSGLMLMKQDGSQVAAKFVGYDSGTGLSLLEAEGLVRARPDSQEAAPAVGQRVRLIAPRPAEVAEAVSTTDAEPRDTPAAGEQATAPVGETGVLYMTLGEVGGELKDVRRSPAGRAVGFTLKVERASPEWAGGVALTEAGSLVGIVEQSSGRETTLLSALAVRAAAERVKARRASVPQPWLGARGDAVAGTRMELFLSQGWPREQAGELLRRQHGVLLTAVAPGTPAARAGLRAGDVISRINNFEVRGVEDVSWILREAGGNRPAEFTILRAFESPQSFQVQLSESQNPALEMARAEAVAAKVETQRAEEVVRRLDGEVRRADEEVAALDETIRKAGPEARPGAPEAKARRDAELEQAAKLRGRLAELQPNLVRAEAEFVRSRERLEAANARLRAATGAGAASAFRPLLPFGVKAMLYMTTVVVSGREVSDRGLVVLEVNRDSPAERAGLRAGDVIETVDGQQPHALDLSDQPPAELDPEPSLAVRRGGERLVVKLGRAAR